MAAFATRAMLGIIAIIYRYLFLVLASNGVLLVSSHAYGGWLQETQAIMGTEVSVELRHHDPEIAKQAVDAVMQFMRHVDVWLSPHKEDSELSRVNRQARLQPVIVSPEFFQLLSRSIHYSYLSQGAFDITFAAVGNQFDYRRQKKPTQSQLNQALPAVNFNDLQLNRERQTVYFLQQKMAIDLGGIAKGYAVDQAIKLVQSLGIQDAYISAGGDSRIIGNKNGRPWMVGIQNPRAKDQVAVMIPLENAALSTSGDYQRFFVEGGIRYHHIIDPKTGQSVDHVRSVSIVADNALETDALSTTVFVLGVKKGLSLINGIENVDAVIIDAEGKMHYSQGLLQAQ